MAMGVRLAQAEMTVVTDGREQNKDDGAWKVASRVEVARGQLAVAARCTWSIRERWVPAVRRVGTKGGKERLVKKTAYR